MAHVQNKPWQKFNFTRWNVFFAKAPGFHVFPSLSKDITLCGVPQIEACSTRSQCAFRGDPHVIHLAKGEGLTETKTRSSSAEVRIRVPDFFSVVHFSRATEPKKGESRALRDLAKGRLSREPRPKGLELLGGRAHQVGMVHQASRS